MATILINGIHRTTKKYFGEETSKILALCDEITHRSYREDERLVHPITGTSFLSGIYNIQERKEITKMWELAHPIEMENYQVIIDLIKEEHQVAATQVAKIAHRHHLQIIQIEGMPDRYNILDRKGDPIALIQC